MSWATLYPAVLLTLAQPAAAPDPKLDAHLAAWEKATQGVTAFRAAFALTRTDPVFNKSREFTGTALVMKPGAAALRIVSKADPNDWDEFVCDGRTFYEYNGRAKTLTEHKVGRLTPVGEDNLLLTILGGLKADELKKRFAVSLSKEDANYVYLTIKPQRPKDRQEFEQAVVILTGPKVPAPHAPYLPAAVRVWKPNGEEERWVLSNPEVNPKGVDARSFAPRDLPGFTRQPARP